MILVIMLSGIYDIVLIFNLTFFTRKFVERILVNNISNPIKMLTKI